jgi:hypothetical protein
MSVWYAVASIALLPSMIRKRLTYILLEKMIVSVKNETMTDVRRSDVKARKPHNSKTYAQDARKEPKRGRVSFEGETRKKHHGLTVKK